MVAVVDSSPADPNIRSSICVLVNPRRRLMEERHRVVGQDIFQESYRRPRLRAPSSCMPCGARRVAACYVTFAILLYVRNYCTVHVLNTLPNLVLLVSECGMLLLELCAALYHSYLCPP